MGARIIVIAVAVVEVLLIVIAFLVRHNKELFQFLSLTAEVIVAFAAVAILIFPEQTATVIYPDLSEYMSDNQTLVDENASLKNSLSELENANSVLQQDIADLEDECADLEQRLKESLIAEISDARLILNGMESPSILHKNIALVDGKEFYDANTVNAISGNRPTYDSAQNAIIIGSQSSVTRFSFSDVSSMLYNGKVYWKYTRGDDATFRVAGKDYSEGFVVGCDHSLFGDGDGYALFNLGGQYVEMSFEVGKTDDYEIQDVTVKISLDGVVTEQYQLSGEATSESITVQLNNANDLKIQITGGSRVKYGFYNVVFST